MEVLAGVDVGNRTTEVAISAYDGRFLASAMVPTTGIKGTRENIAGIVRALGSALSGLRDVVLREIVLCETAPVVFNATVVPREDPRFLASKVLSHNPDTPGGEGAASGLACSVERLGSEAEAHDQPVAVLVDGAVPIERAALLINGAVARGISVATVLMEADEAVLLWNRLARKVPVIDEVRRLSMIPEGVRIATEVARESAGCTALADPFQLAALLDHDRVEDLGSISLSMAGLRSGVVVKADGGALSRPSHLVLERGLEPEVRIRLDRGAEDVNRSVDAALPARDVRVEVGDQLLNPFPALRETFGGSVQPALVQDIYAVNAWYGGDGVERRAPKQGGVGLSALVSDAGALFGDLAAELSACAEWKVTTMQREDEHMIRGAMTTPRLSPPFVVADIGAGSIDIILCDVGRVLHKAVLTGAGDLVDSMLSHALGIADMDLVEALKIHPVGRVERRGVIRLAGGTPLHDARVMHADVVGRSVLLTPDKVVALPSNLNPATILSERRRCKQDVIISNLLRGLARLPMDLAKPKVLLVGGGACDEEVVLLAREALGRLGATVGRGNIRGTEGPRNCVATGLVLSRLALDPGP